MKRINSINTKNHCEDAKFFFLSAFDCVWTKGMILPGFKLIMLMIMMANLFLSAALWVGWPSILGIYKNEGIYSYLCVNNLNTTSTNSTAFGEVDLLSNLTSTNTTKVFITCAAQSDRFTIVYTAASSSYYLGKLYFGYSLDLLGPKITNISANFMVFLGSTFLVFYQCNSDIYCLQISN